MKTVIFLGPSLALDEAKALCDAEYLPPAGQSDLLSAVTDRRPDVIALIDGVFGQSLSVWHKEILYALERGIPVYGASSMGALRGIEMAPYGMTGFGEVYRMYAEGEIDGDDEVALSHADATAGYMGLSLPMVNVRKTYARARDEGYLTAEEHDRAVASAHRIFFPERTVEAICAARELDPDLAKRLRNALTERFVDAKGDDARALLRHLAALGAPPKIKTEPLTRSHLFETLYNRDRKVTHEMAEVRLASVAHQAALTAADFSQLNDHALNRGLAVILFEVMGAELDEADIASEKPRLMNRIGAQDEAALRDWCVVNDLQPEDFDEMLRRQTMVRKMQHWLISRRYLERTTRLVLDELRLSGRYAETKAAAASVEAIVAQNFPDFQQAPGFDLSVIDLLKEHMSVTEFRLDTDFRRWLFEAGFKDVNDLRYELLRHQLARQHLAAVMAQLKEALAEKATYA